MNRIEKYDSQVREQVRLSIKVSEAEEKHGVYSREYLDALDEYYKACMFPKTYAGGKVSFG